MFGSFSNPTNRRPERIQAKPVEPLPIQLSRTVSPSSVYVRTIYSIMSTGFWVGQPPQHMQSALSRRVIVFQPIKILVTVCYIVLRIC